MSIRKSTINDINVSLEPLYLITLPGNNTLVSFDSDGNAINSGISTSTVSNFFDNTDTQVLSTILTDYDYTNSIGYILPTDTLLIALQKAQYQLDVIELSKGANNGIATLDSFGKLLSTQIPASLIGAMVYQGTWDASANTPTLVSSTGNKGHYYIVSTPGATNIDGISVWNANDWVVFDGNTWEKIDNSTVNVLNTPLNGLSSGINTPIISTDSLLIAFQNTQAQLDNKANIISGAQNYLSYFSTNNTLSTSTIYHSAISNNNGSSTLISSNNTATESLTINDFSGNKLVGIRNDGRFIFRSTSIQINDINNTESSAIYIGAGDNVYNTHFHLASRLTGNNDFMSFYNTGASLKTFYYDYNSVLNLQSINTTNSTSLLKMYKSDGTQILSFNNNGLVIGTTPQDVSSVIDLQTISQGLGMPKLLTSQKISITTNRSGLTVYDDTLKSLSFWTGTEWASTLNNTVNGTTYAMPYYNSHTSLSSSSLQYGGSPSLLSLTDVDISDKTIFTINSFGSTDNFKVAHNYTTDKTTFIYNKLNQIVANLSDGDVKIGGASHLSSLSSSSDHISFTDTATNINVWRTSNTGNTFIRTTDNTATNKFFTFTNFGGTQIGYIENGGMVIGSVARNTNLTLDLQSITQAVGLPVLTTLAENNISASSRTGMFLYNSNLSKLRYSDGVSWISVVDSSVFSTLTTNYITKWNGSAFVDSLLTSRSGGLTVNNSTIIDLNTNGKSYFEFYPLIKNTVGTQRYALDIFPSSDTTYTGFVDIIGIKSGGDVQNSKNTLKKAITITHRSTDSTGGNQNAILIDAQMHRPQISAVSQGASGVHHITSVNADNYTSIVQAGANGSNPIHYSAYSQRDNAIGFQHNKIISTNSGVQTRHNCNILTSSQTTWSNGFGFSISNMLINSNASPQIVDLQEEYIIQNQGAGTVYSGKRYRNVGVNQAGASSYMMGIYPTGVTIGNTTALPNTATQLDLVGTTTGLGLNLVPTASLPTASTRKGNLLFDSTSNTLKVSDGTSWVSPLIPSGLTTNILPKWNGTTLVNSDLSGTGGDLTLFGTGNTNRMVFATSNSPTHGGLALQTAGGTDIWSLRTSPVGGATTLSASAMMNISGYAGSATINMGSDLSSGRYVSTNAQYDASYSTATSKTTRISSQYGTIIGPNLVSGGNLGQWYTNNSLNNGNALSVVGGGHFTTGIIIGGNTINTVTQLDLQSTTKGLGLPLVPTASLPTASTRKGNFLFDSTKNILKFSDGTNWMNLGSVTSTANVSFGHLALDVATGSRNTAMGTWSGSSITTGGNNTALGAYALQYNTTGYYNTAIGDSALIQTTGGGNTAIGFQSLYSNISGVANVAIGSNAGISNTADNNVFIGHSSGSTLGTETNSVAIGQGSIITASNQVVLGNNLTTSVITSGVLSTGDVTYPIAHGTNGQVLTTTGSGTLTWTTVTSGTTYSAGNGLSIEDNTIKLGGVLTDDNTRLTVDSPNKNFFIGAPINGQDLQFISLSSTVLNINNSADHDTAQGNTMYITPGGLISINQYLSGVQTVINGTPEAVSIRYSDDKVFKLHLFGGLNSGETLTINDITFTEGVDFYMQGGRDLDVEHIIDTLPWNTIPNFLSVKKEFDEFNEPVIIISFSEISTITSTISNLIIYSYQNQKRVLVDENGVLLKSRNNEITLTDTDTNINSKNVNIIQKNEEGVIKNTVFSNSYGSFLWNADSTDSSVSSSSVVGNFGSNISNSNNRKIGLSIVGEILSGESFTVNGITFTEGIDFTTVNDPNLDALAISEIDYSSVPNFISVSVDANFITFTFSVVDNTITTTISNVYVVNYLSNSSVFAGKNFAAIQSNNSELRIGYEGHTFTDNTSEKQGIRYAGDYSATYTDRSLVDKAYADSLNTNAVDKDTVKLAENINKGQAVYVSGANGTNIIVSKASNTTEATSSKTFGLLESSGVTNDFVNVVTRGLLTGLDTSTATIGDAVWLGTDGNLIYGLTNKPYAPAHLVFVGIVTRVQSENGEIFVNIQNGFELNEIHNVSITTPNDNQALIYETSSGLWKNKAVNLGLTYTSGTPIVTMTGTGTFTLDTANYTKYNYTSLASSTTVYNVTNTQTMIEFTDAAFDQLVNLPDATTCNLGQQFNFINSNATNPVTIRNFVGVTIGIIGITATECTITCVSNTTASGSWNIRQNDRAIALRIATSAGTTHNSATAIDIQLTNKGLGLPLVPTDSLPTASLRTGNLLFDSTTNTLKVSDGTNWNNVNTGVSSAVMVGILDADQSVTTSTDISPNFVAQADPNSWFNSGTQRVTPTIAGYYNVSYSVWWGANSSTNQVNVQIRKNGNSQAIYQRLSSSVAVGFTMGGSKVVYMNGTTDYFDFVVFTSDANTIFKGNVDGSGTYFSVHLLR